MHLRRAILCMTSFTALASVAACGKNDHSITSPLVATPCGSGGTVQLAVLQAATIACSGGTRVTLAGNGASYLIVPQFATGTAAKTPNAYTIGPVSGASANRVPTDLPTMDLTPWEGGQTIPSSMRRGNPQRALDAWLMAEARRNLASGAWRPSLRQFAPGTSTRLAALQVGDLSKFHVLASEKPVQFKAVGARLAYIGTNVLIYVDTLSPANFTATQLNAFGQLFDQTLYPLDANAFGAPSDIDGNGHVIVLLSPVVNALTPASDCANGFTAGFFVPHDLIFADTSSNKGEIFYSLAPDPNGTVSCPHSVNELDQITPAIFLHELQHLINFSQHVLVHNGSPEFGWLDEGLSIVAEELGSIYYEDKFPPPTGRTNPAQLFPDSSQGFISDALFDSYYFLLKPDTASTTLHSDDEGGLAWRGGDWLLVRWLGDVKGTGIFKALAQSSLTGTDNIASAAGESFDGLFGDFSLALYTDSLPAVPKSSIPQRNKFARRNLRQMYNRLYQTSGGDPSIPRPFPISVTSLTSSISAKMVAGTMSFYQLSSSAGQATVTIDFGATPGVPISAGLHPQVSIFRLQ